MRVCSYCATLAFLLGVLLVLYIWPVFNRGLQSGSYPSYNAGYAGSGGYGGGTGDTVAGTDTVATVAMEGMVGTAGMAATVGTVVTGMAEAHLAGHGVSRHMRSMPPINLAGLLLPPVTLPATNLTGRNSEDVSEK